MVGIQLHQWEEVGEEGGEVRHIVVVNTMDGKQISRPRFWRSAAVMLVITPTPQKYVK